MTILSQHVVLLQTAGRAVLRATGKQAMGSLFLFISFYLFGLPIAIPLMLATPLAVKGSSSFGFLSFI